MRRLRNYWSGVTMVARTSFKRFLLLTSFGIVVLLTTWALFTPRLFLGELLPLPRLGIPALLGVAFVGAIFRRSNIVKVGWLGLVLYLVTVVLTLNPGEDEVLKEVEPIPVDPRELAIRLALLCVLAVLQAVCVRLALKSNSGLVQKGDAAHGDQGGLH
jgi:hypothetical protein